VVSAGTLRELWDDLSELRNSLCEIRMERIELRPAILPVKTVQLLSFSVRYDRHHTVKSLSLTESVYGALKNCSTAGLFSSGYHVRN
jgi:hypothetical protein